MSTLKMALLSIVLSVAQMSFSVDPQAALLAIVRQANKFLESSYHMPDKRAAHDVTGYFTVYNIEAKNATWPSSEEDKKNQPNSSLTHVPTFWRLL